MAQRTFLCCVWRGPAEVCEPRMAVYSVYSVYNHALPPPLGQVPGFIVAISVITSCLGTGTRHTLDCGQTTVCIHQTGGMSSVQMRSIGHRCVVKHIRLVFMRNEILWCMQEL